jgi:hypothetical protein
VSEHGGHHGGGDSGGSSGASDFGGHHSHSGQASHSGPFPDSSAYGHHGHPGQHWHGQQGGQGTPGQLDGQWLPYEGMDSPASPQALQRAMARHGVYGLVAGMPGARIVAGIIVVVALVILAVFGFVLAAIIGASGS